mgnify:CR=1 FL=1
MAKTRSEKEHFIAELTESINKTKSIVFADFQGLKATEITELRRACKKAGIGYMVGKKTLLKLAFKANNLEIDPKGLEGSFATLFGFGDEVQPAKIAADFTKAHEALKIIGGVLEKKLVDKASIIALAKLPSKQELFAKMVGSMQAPLAGFVNVLAGNLRGLVQVLNAYEQNKSGSQA